MTMPETTWEDSPGTSLKYVVKVSEQVIWPPDLSALSQEGIYYMPRTGEELSGP